MFSLYLSNSTYDLLKITSKVLNIEQRMPKNRFQSWKMNIFARFLAKVPPIDSI